MSPDEKDAARLVPLWVCERRCGYEFDLRDLTMPTHTERAKDQLVRGYKITIEGGMGWLYAGETLEDVNTALDQVVALAELEVGDIVTIEVIEQTQGTIDDMPDFGGW